MENQNWSQIGSNISEMVQDAIDSGDFGRLSQAIRDTVSDAVSETVSGAVTGAMDGVTQGMEAVGESINKAAENLNGWKYKSVQNPQKWKKWETAQNSWKENGKFEKKTMDYMWERDIPKAELYRAGMSARAGAYVMSVLGGIGCFSFGIAMFVLLVILMVTGAAGLLIPLGISVPFLVLSIVFCARGNVILGRFRRFKRYVRILGERRCIALQELASSMNRTIEYVRKDLGVMIEKEMFLQGHLAGDGRSLFVTDESYHAYIKSSQQMEMREHKKMQEKKQNGGTKKERELPEDVKKLIAEGGEYIEKIRMSNEAIKDAKVSEKLDHLEEIVTRIFAYVEQEPGSAPETKKLMKYYLPTTIRLLETYQKLDAQPVKGENIDKSKREIEEALDTLNQAFARLFDNLYQDMSMDIVSDISVLNTMLAQEGLIGDKL